MNTAPYLESDGGCSDTAKSTMVVACTIPPRPSLWRNKMVSAKEIPHFLSLVDRAGYFIVAARKGDAGREGRPVTRGSSSSATC